MAKSISTELISKRDLLIMPFEVISFEIAFIAEKYLYIDESDKFVVLFNQSEKLLFKVTLLLTFQK